jgi:hypothetical protein
VVQLIPPFDLGFLIPEGEHRWSSLSRGPSQRISTATGFTPRPGTLIVVEWGRTDAEGDVAIQIAGLPATGPLSAIISSTAWVTGVRTQTKVDPAVLHTPAGEMSLDVDIEMQVPITTGRPRFTPRLRGANGTGLFERTRVAGDLRGAARSPRDTTIPVSGTFILGFRGVDETRAAAGRGLAANTMLTEEQRAQLLERVTAALAQSQVADFPPEVAAAPSFPPERAVVEHTVRREGERLKVSLRIIVPAGDAKQSVRVVAVGIEGARTVYEGAHAPGEVLSLEVEGTDPLIIQVYVAGKTAAQIRAQPDS